MKTVRQFPKGLDIEWESAESLFFSQDQPGLIARSYIELGLTCFDVVENWNSSWGQAVWDRFKLAVVACCCCEMVAQIYLINC